MSQLNHVLVALILLLLAGNAGGVYFIIQSQEKRKERADKLAETVSEVNRILEGTVGTTASVNVSFGPAIGASPAQGSLSREAYVTERDSTKAGTPQFDAQLAHVVKNAESVCAQSKLLADKLNRTATLLGIDMNRAQQNPGGYVAHTRRLAALADAIAEQARAVAERDELMLDSLLKIAEAVDFTMDEELFGKREKRLDQGGVLVLGAFGVKPQLTYLERCVARQSDRSAAFESFLAKQLPNTLSEYAWRCNFEKREWRKMPKVALRELTADIRAVNLKLRELAIAKADLRTTRKELAETETELTKKTDLLRKKTAQIEGLKAVHDL